MGGGVQEGITWALARRCVWCWAFGGIPPPPLCCTQPRSASLDTRMHAYTQGKLFTEQLLAERGVNWTSVRPVYIYGPLNYNPVEEWFFHRIKAGRPIPVPGTGMQVGRGLGSGTTAALAAEPAIPAPETAMQCHDGHSFSSMLYWAMETSAGRVPSLPPPPLPAPTHAVLCAGHPAGPREGPGHCICQDPRQPEGRVPGAIPPIIFPPPPVHMHTAACACVCYTCTGLYWAQELQTHMLNSRRER